MSSPIRQFIRNMTTLRVAYVPEHFSTPLFFAKEHKFYDEHNIKVEFLPVPEGTGRLIQLLNNNETDIAVGLTEGFIADIAKGNEKYKAVGTYVKSPLRWSVSTGSDRNDINKLEDLAGKRIGVSRIGSGSYIMSFVLGLQHKFPEPFFHGHPVCSNFANLRASVNHTISDPDQYSDAFMWEHFTSKKYYDNGEIKKIGDIYTPWPSWMITARSEIVNSDSKAIVGFLKAVREGILHFQANHSEATEFIASNLDYSKEDATSWIDTVTFNDKLSQEGVDWTSVAQNTASVLQTAGVLTDDSSVIEARLKNGVDYLV
ncbi:Piso0_001352 [Millerozyma farinosa CBS 7064]|uniref:Piso0_001352 protein n=1 Tax=Pichia sorbitophila (strain ATCC MYA-4447 / BCRC 22081 / CBS 7064 / NBRC 10061 / NRRL Y-12695) TaxID=559304 RepID=G8YMI7_PICSO|nr:Piso0_001352 [Millerozyma farinosa CBS 7064]